MSAWWHDEGQVRFPKLFITATLYLSKPYTNAFQERVFSICTWPDSALRQSQTADTLAVRALDRFNRSNVADLQQARDLIAGKEAAAAAQVQHGDSAVHLKAGRNN